MKSLIFKAAPDLKYIGTLKLIHVNQILQFALGLPEPKEESFAEVPVVFSVESQFSGINSNFVNRIYIYSINGVEVEPAHAWVGNISSVGSQDYLFVIDGCSFKITDIEELAA